MDGILCWDVFDYLDREAGRTLATRLKAILKPGGALYGLFGTTDIELTHYSRFLVEGEDAIRVRPYPATKVRRTVLVIAGRQQDVRRAERCRIRPAQDQRPGVSLP